MAAAAVGRNLIPQLWWKGSGLSCRFILGLTRGPAKKAGIDGSHRVEKVVNSLFTLVSRLGVGGRCAVSPALRILKQLANVRYPATNQLYVFESTSSRLRLR